MNTPTLHDLLHAATEKRVIRGWSVDGMDVVLHYDGVKLPVPALTAITYLRKLIADSDEQKYRDAPGKSRFHVPGVA